MMLNPDTLKILNDADTALKSHEFVTVYDTETSGLTAGKDRILSFSAIRFKLPEMIEDDRLDIFIQCPFSIPKNISDINHIDDELLENYGIDEISAFKAIKTFLRDGGLLAGQNIISFDNKFMEALYKQFGESFLDKFEFVDTLLIARATIDQNMVMVFNEKYHKMRPSYKLENLVNYFHINEEYEFNFHSSIEDVKATALVLNKLREKINEIIEKEEQKKEPVSFQKKRAEINSISFFNPSMMLQRIYINTNQGTFFYDILKDIWEAKPGYGNLLSIDLDELISDVLAFKKVSTIKELISVVRSEDRRKKTA